VRVHARVLPQRIGERYQAVIPEWPLPQQQHQQQPNLAALQAQFDQAPQPQPPQQQ
jgi:hypothetical protein